MKRDKSYELQERKRGRKATQDEMSTNQRPPNHEEEEEIPLRCPEFNYNGYQLNMWSPQVRMECEE